MIENHIDRLEKPVHAEVFDFKSMQREDLNNMLNESLGASALSIDRNARIEEIDNATEAMTNGFTEAM